MLIGLTLVRQNESWIYVAVVFISSGQRKAEIIKWFACPLLSIYSVLVSISCPKALYHLESDNIFRITVAVADWLGLKSISP